MEKQFVPYELALELKDLGFKEPCIARYVSGLFGFEKTERKLEIWNDEDFDIIYSSIKAPLWQQAFEFLKEKHDFKYPYEESRLECLKKIIEMIKK